MAYVSLLYRNRACVVAVGESWHLHVENVLEGAAATIESNTPILVMLVRMKSQQSWCPHGVVITAWSTRMGRLGATAAKSWLKVGDALAWF